MPLGCKLLSKTLKHAPNIPHQALHRYVIDALRLSWLALQRSAHLSVLASIHENVRSTNHLLDNTLKLGSTNSS
jgi:hypothetical protein